MYIFSRLLADVTSRYRKGVPNHHMYILKSPNPTNQCIAPSMPRLNARETQHTQNAIPIYANVLRHHIIYAPTSPNTLPNPCLAQMPALSYIPRTHSGSTTSTATVYPDPASDKPCTPSDTLYSSCCAWSGAIGSTAAARYSAVHLGRSCLAEQAALGWGSRSWRAGENSAAARIRGRRARVVVLGCWMSCRAFEAVGSALLAAPR